jgi:hypothetical protein
MCCGFCYQSDLGFVQRNPDEVRHASLTEHVPAMAVALLPERSGIPGGRLH